MDFETDQDALLYKSICSVSNKLSKYLSTEKSNVLYSPLSVSLALLLLLNGTSEQADSREELLAFFDIVDDRGEKLDKLNSIMNTSLKAYFSQDKNGSANKDQTDFIVGNSLWGDQIFPSYVSRIQDLFEAEGFPVPKNGKEVNDWIEQKTNGHLKRFFDDDKQFSKDSVMLLNSVYFRGNWAIPFDQQQSYMGEFSTSKTHMAEVRMMRSSGEKWEHKENGKYEVLRLQYKDTKFSASIVLPKEVLTFQEAEAMMTKEDWDFVYLQRSMDNEGTVIIPKFDLEHSVELKDGLVKSGVKKIFNRAESGLTELCASPIEVKQVYHKCRIQVDETGSTASAATAILMMKCCLPISPPFYFECNRPFYFIIHTDRGIPLFVSYVQDPK
ncbi:hypothetical protein K493DRAFT_319740 [Basidiobolus meristosporus CBS 931.73]|uniref:Serpin domain-containing protein n=1 Tax=Basidiobolus meristosporus CBS 931.73 TaxID=1314790 RepID=A0A1Y1XME7_9FUNG|nr:hypothetical protein K493DRAFT_319740 [Basidiobolus meristosporus CBS 931.73]|eukprot:ORX86865.1 hypothetical protein K493DRAFT_319740 [Basidiobolus meristosporus CBS 931.73]